MVPKVLVEVEVTLTMLIDGEGLNPPVTSHTERIVCQPGTAQLEREYLNTMAQKAFIMAGGELIREKSDVA